MKATTTFSLILAIWLTAVACTSSSSSAPSAACGSTGAIPTGSATAAAPAVVALSGCTMIDYSFPVTIGGQGSINVIADSGSTMLAVAASNCSNCTSISPTYPVTHGADLCTSVNSTYGDGTGWTAEAYQDTVQVGPLPPIFDNIAAISSQSDSFFNSYDCFGGSNGTNSSQGIMGLAFSGLVSSPTVGFLDAIQAPQITSFPDKFATQLCMTGGQIWFGGYDSAYTTGAVQYTPISPPSGYSGLYYWVTINDIQVGGTTIGQPASAYGTPIVDTGTSVALLPTSVFNALQSAIAAYPAFQSLVGSGEASHWFTDGNCISSTTQPSTLNGSLPQLTMVFPSAGSGNISVNMPATLSYIFYYKDVSDNLWYCPGVAPNSGVGLTIIGGTFLRSLITVFDRANNQVGFAPGQGCPF